MKEIELKNNPLGIRVYAVGEPDIDHMTEEEYNLFASSLAMRMLFRLLHTVSTTRFSISFKTSSS